jgi:hypothetical protein
MKIKLLLKIKPLKPRFERLLKMLIHSLPTNSSGGISDCARQSLKIHIFAITPLIKNPHEEVEENSFKNNIYQFHGVTPYVCLQISGDDAFYAF